MCIIVVSFDFIGLLRVISRVRRTPGQNFCIFKFQIQFILISRRKRGIEWSITCILTRNLSFRHAYQCLNMKKILNLKFGSQLDTKCDHWLFLGTKDWKTCAKCWIIYSRLNLSIISCLHNIQSNRLISDCSHYI